MRMQIRALIVLLPLVSAACGPAYTLRDIKNEAGRQTEGDRRVLWSARESECQDVSDRLDFERVDNPRFVDPAAEETQLARALDRESRRIVNHNGRTLGWEPRTFAFLDPLSRVTEESRRHWSYVPSGVEPNWLVSFKEMGTKTPDGGYGTSVTMSVSTLQQSVDGSPFPPSGPCVIGKKTKHFGPEQPLRGGSSSPAQPGSRPFGGD